MSTQSELVLNLSVVQKVDLLDWERYAINHYFQPDESYILLRDCRAIVSKERIVHLLDHNIVEIGWEDIENEFHRMHDEPDRVAAILEAKKFFLR